MYFIGLIMYWLVWYMFMLFKATFNNISVISCPSKPEKITNLRLVTDKLYHMMCVSSTPHLELNSNSQL